MQLSNWEVRPLTARQVAYAAQDAHVLLLLYKQLQLGLGGQQELQQLLATNMIKYHVSKALI